MKISIIGTVGIPASYGGFETFTENLVKELAEKHDITVYCSEKHYNEKLENHHGAKLVYLPLKANGWQSILYDALAIFRSMRSAQKLLILGVSGAICLPVFKIFSRNEVIINLDGVEWKREKWSFTAKLFLRLSEFLAIKFSDKIISDNIGIQQYVQSKYGKQTTMIPYAGDHIIITPEESYILDELELTKEEYFINIARIEPENNSHIILEAFKQIPSEVLVIFGNWDASDYSKSLYQRYSKCTNIRMLPAWFDRQKEKNYLRANCKAYLHGHSAGGTSPALVEAICLNRYPICYDVSYNRYTCDNLGMYFTSVYDLKQKITEMNKETLNQTAEDLNKLCNNRYRWGIIASQYENLLQK